MVPCICYFELRFWCCFPCFCLLKTSCLLNYLREFPPPCSLSTSCSLNYFERIFHPVRLLHPVLLIDSSEYWFWGSGINEGLVECATVWVKSVVILALIFRVNVWSIVSIYWNYTSYNKSGQIWTGLYTIKLCETRIWRLPAPQRRQDSYYSKWLPMYYDNYCL